ncbi:Os05g0276000 [Oryza sativa Japonica Group]|uniref:Uncharacterized protein n=2 Tax=Oryza sativa subsp. japonica TaxID=39947 RepID=A0A8J8YD54_ORYSJ|nr:hypothetical protein OsJ_17881 [Oryza sativa Japonica Group]BAS93114.1 Os05g0276000 [Oryza sativa Japonica Group]
MRDVVRSHSTCSHPHGVTSDYIHMANTPIGSNNIGLNMIEHRLDSVTSDYIHMAITSYSGRPYHLPLEHDPCGLSLGHTSPRVRLLRAYQPPGCGSPWAELGAHSPPGAMLGVRLSPAPMYMG